MSLRDQNCVCGVVSVKNHSALLQLRYHSALLQRLLWRCSKPVVITIQSESKQRFFGLTVKIAIMAEHSNIQL